MISNSNSDTGADTPSGSDLQANVRNLADKAKETFSKVADDVKTFSEDPETNGREMAQQARAQFDKAAERAEQHVREKPVESVLALLAVGFVAGFILRGSHR